MVDILQETPKYGHASFRRPSENFIHQFRTGTGSGQEHSTSAIADSDGLYLLFCVCAYLIVCMCERERDNSRSICDFMGFNVLNVNFFN